MKAIETIWFTNKDGVIGIVIAEEDVSGARKALIGIGAGFDEKQDTEAILAWGNKLSFDTVVKIAHLLGQPPSAKAGTPGPEMLKRLIDFWEGELFHCRFLMSPSTQTLVEHTVKYLKELQETKEKACPNS